MKKILITGAGGFIGRNLVAELSRLKDEYELFLYDIGSTDAELQDYCSRCDFVVHLAGVNRPKDDSEFITGNAGLTDVIIGKLAAAGNKVPVLITSSIQSDLDNAYGRSKRLAEETVLAYGRDNDVPVYVFKLPNVFGKWCRPNYNSAVATFCHNIANGLPITVNDPERVMTLIYIDDVIELIKKSIAGEKTADADGYCSVEKVYTAKLGEIAELLYSFKAMKNDLMVPLLEGLAKPLYSTYLSYLPSDGFSYSPVAHTDQRGLFAELFKTKEIGQFSVSTTAPGITRGNHWHHTKVEKFIVVAGRASIRFRRIDSAEIIEYIVSGEKPEVVDIPVGYTHSITNISEDETLVTLIWANELLDPDRPDTYYLEV